MSALCNCFKTNPQVTDNESRRKANRNSIRSQKQGMDVLEINKRGMETNEEWIEDDSNNDDHRVSQQTEMLNAGRFNDATNVSQSLLNCLSPANRRPLY